MKAGETSLASTRNEEQAADPASPTSLSVAGEASSEDSSSIPPPVQAPARSARKRRLHSQVSFSDRIEPRHRRREDLFDVVVALLGIALTWTIGYFANSTTQGVTEDVLRFQFIRDALLLPITLIEGTVVLVAPIAVVAALALRRRLNTILQSIGAAIVAALGGWGILVALSYLPVMLTAPFRVAEYAGIDGTPTTTIGLNIVIITLSALFTSAGEAQNMRTVRWSWIGLSAILLFGVLRSSMTLPGAVVSLLLGRAVGSMSRWFFGFEDRRASGADIVGALLDLGAVPTTIVRTDLDTSERPLITRVVVENDRGRLRLENHKTPPADYTVTRRADQDANRHYQATLDDGRILEVVVLDPGREIVGTLVDVWNNIRLRGISRWVSPSMKAGAERAMLVAVSARRAGVRAPEPLGIALAADSIVSVSEALPPTTPLHDIPAELVPERLLDEAWTQLLAAHAKGISHRDLTFDAIVVDEDQELWILDWERGEVASTELSRRIDIAQMLVHQALCVGEDRALESARRIVDERMLRSCAAVLQGAVLPTSLNQALRRTDIVEKLRTRVLGVDEGEAVELTDIQRFRPRTLVTMTLLFVALVVVLGSLNFEDIWAAVVQANPWWMGLAFLLASLTWAGGAIPLMALSPVKLRFRDAFTAQVGASLATIVAPAGVGPAVVNLRVLKKKRVSTVLAATTVTLQQVIQLVVMLSFLLLFMVLSGRTLSVQLPYGTILAIATLVVVGIGIALSVPAVRRWIWSKLEPSFTQVYPRLIWLAGQPRRILAIFGGNVVMNIGFVGAFWASLVAMGGSLDFVSLALTYLASNSLGSVVPSPGGIGPVEAALTAGLQVAGIPLSIGLPTAVLYRLVTFYGRIPFGWLAMKWLERKDLI